MISSSVSIQTQNLNLVPFRIEFKSLIQEALQKEEILNFLALSEYQKKEWLESLDEITYFPRSVDLSKNHANKNLWIQLPHPSFLQAPWDQFKISCRTETNTGQDLQQLKIPQEIHFSETTTSFANHSNSEINQLWWCILDKETSKFIGMTGFNAFHLLHEKAEFIFWILPDFNGRGYLSEGLYGLSYYGFNILNLHRIEVFIISDNINCDRAFAKTPYIQEGFLVDYEKINGKFHSYLLYALTNPKHH